MHSGAAARRRLADRLTYLIELEQPFPELRSSLKLRRRALYVLLCALSRLALQPTKFAKATCGTIRLKLLKIGALVRTSVRRITSAMASGYPYQPDFARAHTELTAAAAR